MGNSLKTLLQVGVIGTMVGVFGGENQDKKVDSNVDVSKSAISNLLSNEAYAATQINPVEFREAKEVSTTLDLINNISEFNISEATFNKIQEIIKVGESNTRFISQIITDDKTGAVIEIYKTGEGKMGVELQDVSIDDKGNSKPKGEPVKMEVGNGPLTISKGLVTMKTNSEGFITEISVGEASKGGEFTTIGCATPISKGMAMAIIAEFGAENLKVASSIGIKVGEKGKLMAVVNFVSAEGTYSVPFFEGGKSETVDKTMVQVGGKVKYEQQVKSELIKKLKLYYVGLGLSKSNDNVMEEKTVDYNSEFYKVLKRGVEGATVVLATVGTTFELTKDVTVRVELNGDYITWNITGDNETSVGVGGQINIKDIAKDMDSLSIDGDYSDLNRRVGLNYTYPINDSVDLTASLEQRFETKYYEIEETRVMAGLRYHFPVYDAGNKIVSKGSKNVIINGDASLTESVFNFAKQSLSYRVNARAFKHEELKAKPQVETPVTPTTPETPDTGLEDFNPRDKTLKVGDTYDTGLRNNKIKFNIEGNNGIVTESNGKIKGLKEGNVTVYVTDGKLTKHFKVYVKEKPVDGPEVKDDSFTTNKNTPIHGADIKANDGAGVVVTGNKRNEENCTVEIVDGKANITPKTDFVGNATFEYEGKKNGISKWAKVTVKVEGGTDPENNKPTANAGVDKTINSGDSVTLNGTGADTDGSISAYEWSTGGSVVGSAKDLTISPTTTTTYKFRVKDNKGLWSEYDEVQVTVSGTPGNNLPTANAGADKSINSGESVTLAGSGTDTDGTITAYEWSTGATTASISVSPTTTTTYTLRVKDDKGAWSAVDSVTVTVNAANTAPTGENKTLNAGGERSSSTTVNTSDPDVEDTTSIEFVGSGVLFGDANISSATASGNTVSISINGGSGNCYIDYKVKDSKGKYSDLTYRVTFNQLSF